MKKFLAILFLTGTINLAAMEPESEKINLEVSLESSVPVYMLSNGNYSVSTELQKTLNKSFNEKTLLQKVCILNPNASNKQQLEYIKIKDTNTPSTSIKIPKYLPLELLPSKDGETKTLDLYFSQNYVQDKITIELTAKQKGLNLYEYNNKPFANLKRELATLAIEHPPSDKIDCLIKTGFIKKRWRFFGGWVPGSKNQYLPADKTDIYTLAGFGSIAALGLFAWWKKWFN